MMTNVSLRYSPTLAISGLDPKLVHKEKMKEYIRQLEKGETILKERALTEIFGENENLTRFEFVTLFMANPLQQKLLSTQSIRNMLYDIYKNTSPTDLSADPQFKTLAKNN